MEDQYTQINEKGNFGYLYGRTRQHPAVINFHHGGGGGGGGGECYSNCNSDGVRLDITPSNPNNCLEPSDCRSPQRRLHDRSWIHAAASSSQQIRKFQDYPSVADGGDGAAERGVEEMKAKIVAHPQYSNLLDAYLDCRKVGAPPEVVAQLAAARQEFEASHLASVATRDSGKDPELDQFMEAYYDMLVKYREELTRPVQEAMEFMRRIEAQLLLLTNARAPSLTSDDKSEGVGSSEEEQEEHNNNNEGEIVEGNGDQHQIDPRAEDRELKQHLLKKYSGYLSSLKQELSKKKKKGKLPKEARQKLLSWWELHYKWPYPSESEKVALAEATGLDQKQINNWFINQRKRHWKPSEDMQFMVMDQIHPHSAPLYIDGHYMGADGPFRFGS